MVARLTSVCTTLPGGSFFCSAATNAFAASSCSGTFSRSLWKSPTRILPIVASIFLPVEILGFSSTTSYAAYASAGLAASDDRRPLAALGTTLVEILPDMETLPDPGAGTRGGPAVAVVGDSNVVGMPMSWLMRDAGAASTTLLHTQAVNFLKRYRDMDLADRIDGIACPTLVVTGTRDTSTPYAGHGEHLIARIPGAAHVALEAAHLAPLEAPEALASAITSFLES